MAACGPSGNGETTPNSATTGVPSTTSEPATTGVQTTTADISATSSAARPTVTETLFPETSPIESATSSEPAVTSSLPDVSQTETTTNSPSTTVQGTTSSLPPETSASATTTQGETTVPAPAATDAGSTAPTTSVSTTTAPTASTTTVPETTTAIAQKIWSCGENFGWQQRGIKLGTAYSGEAMISFDITSPEKAGAAVGFADKDSVVEGFDDLILMFRMNENAAVEQEEETKGYFDASSDGIYDRLETVYYHANITYHVEIEVNFTAKTYDVWVVTPEAGKVKIAEEYEFKYPAGSTADDIGQAFVISKFANDLVYIQNLKIEEKPGGQV